MSHDRGLDLQNALAEYLAANGFPHARSTGAGRPGVDVENTPGLAWENKTADQFRILDFVRQARDNAGALDVPVVVYWPRGAGRKSVEQLPAIVPLAWLVRVLRGAGYGDPLPEPATLASALRDSLRNGGGRE